MLIVEHDLKNIEKSFYLASLYKNRRLVVIRNFSDDPLLSEVNPHFFGCFESDARSTEDVTTFVVAGGLGLERRNPALLVEGVRYLLGKGIDDFRVVVVGSGRPDGFPDDVAAKVLWMGRLDYPKLYETVRSSSFFLPLLDPDMQEHHKYRTSVSSGSIQLIYGCLIIPVISRVFAVAYGFSEETCVVYDGNEIGMAMERAVETQRDTLMQMKDNLIDKRKEIQSASLNRISFFF
jgi:glycosyltransferase involved in cell wall biosynthesis